MNAQATTTTAPRTTSPVSVNGIELDKLKTAVSSGEFRIEPAGEDTQPLDALLQRERSEMLFQCLEELSEEHREVILLRRIAGASPDYVAEVMNRTNTQAISALCGRAEARLASVMRKRRMDLDDESS